MLFITRLSQNLRTVGGRMQFSKSGRITTNWEILQEMGIPYHLTRLLRNLYAGQEAPVRTGHGTRDWFQIGKGVCRGCIVSSCLFNLYVEYIMQNARLD